VNKQITQVFALMLILFAVLVGASSWWTVFGADGLKNNPSNRRGLLQEQRIPRGLILTDNGDAAARSVRQGRGNSLRYVRTYPTGNLFSNVIGYSFIQLGRAGLEKSENDALAGNQNEFSSIVDQLLNRPQEGFDVHTTLDTGAQRLARQLLAGKGRGSVVAIEPKTGRVRVMLSLPDYDPNTIPQDFKQLNRDPSSPLFNRATQSGYPPGSTMKVVTASAALDSGRYTPNSVVSGKSPKIVGGVPLSNCCTEGSGNFGPLTLSEALAKSVNTVWGEVGEKLGKNTMFEYMRRFGFDSKPPIDLPRDELRASGVYGRGGKLLDEHDAIDIGRVAIGQERLNVTPLQMAEVAATVANGGVRMRPQLVDRVVARDGRVKERRKPEEIQRVIKESTAGEVTQMMQGVVDHGTAVAAKIPGVPVAGKTGTAEVDNGAANQAWFIAFAPANDPKIAIAVTVERTQGEGGTEAAPIAKQIIQYLLGKG
jgi:penicillin-binding protein A